MKNLFPKTHEEVCQKKRRFMRLAQIEVDPEQREVYEQAVNHCDRLTARLIEKAKRIGFFLLLLFALSMFGGCKAGVGVGLDGEVFYPEIQTSKGGSFGDPTGSREQSTQHTTGMARNNLPMVGGAE